MRSREGSASLRQPEQKSCGWGREADEKCRGKLEEKGEGEERGVKACRRKSFRMIC